MANSGDNSRENSIVEESASELPVNDEEMNPGIGEVDGMTED